MDDLSSWQDKSSSQKGWVSIDRSMVAALPSTTPRPAHKSSTDGLGPSTLPSGWRGELPSALGRAAKFPRSGRSPKTNAPRAIKNYEGRAYVQVRSTWTKKANSTILGYTTIVATIVYYTILYSKDREEEARRRQCIVLENAAPGDGQRATSGDDDSTILQEHWWVTAGSER